MGDVSGVTGRWRRCVGIGRIEEGLGSLSYFNTLQTYSLMLDTQAHDMINDAASARGLRAGDLAPGIGG